MKNRFGGLLRAFFGIKIRFWAFILACAICVAATYRLTVRSERDRIVAAILACKGVMAGSRGVAAMLGLKRTTLLSRMQRMGIDIKDVLETRGQSLPA